MADNKAQPDQIDKFRDLARELECDEEEAGFEEKLRRVAKSPPQQKPAGPSEAAE